MTDASPDAFAAVRDLLTLVTDAKTCSARLTELHKLTDQVAKAQAKLGAERDAIAADRAALEATKAELAERASELAKRDLALRAREEALRGRAQALAASRPPRFPHDPNLFGTVTREPA